ncbi:MAG: PDZ domain-containing protein [Planctomycetaceae bacterium]|nr:PDZ domain-containing protein [Planctomycetaceae bacterium]MCP4478468.1 PDZ domain-containing protein [Planctomycetaceae bacterium]MCP4776119.1 PDZ domain-containing protein [Planctomycetaceae bacterium]
MDYLLLANRARLLGRFKVPCAVLAVFLWSALLSNGLQAQSTAQPKTSVVDSAETPSVGNSVQQQGEVFESQKQWGEALALYQNALKANPDDRTLQLKRAFARIHFDLDRRYADTSFIKTIKSTDANTSMNVYAEVLLKIQSYYVDEPNWANIVNYGLTSLKVAMQSDGFRQINLPTISKEASLEVYLQAEQRLSNVAVRTRNDAFTVARETADFLNKQCGMSSQSVMYEFVCGAISALDPYSAFMSSNQYSETMSQIEGNFVGLGVELRTQADYLEIVSVISKGPAGMGGIIEGDRIVAVDNQKVSEIGSNRAADMMRGLEGSFILISLDRGNGIQTLRLQRRRVDIPSVDQVGLVDKASGVGYIKLTNFQKTTAADFDAALWKLKAQGMRSLIVDVRGNPGGLLSASVEVADRFVRKGVIVSTKGRNPMEDFVHTANLSGTWDVPLVVLVDENSASASEIFAAAISDNKRGTIVGNQSYGKGSVQGIFPLNVSGGGVRLTTAKFYSPTGQAISRVGVKADIVIQDVLKPGENIDSQVDTGLRVGIKTAQQKMVDRNAALRSKVSSVGG